MKHPRKVPFLVYADSRGNLFEDRKLLAVGRSGFTTRVLSPEDFIELPYGSDFFLLPNRLPLGYNPKTGNLELSDKGTAAAAFASPAYTQTYMAAYKTLDDSPRLPLYAYTALGWLDGKFYATVLRTDPDIRQDCEQFDQKIVIRNAKAMLKANKTNRLLKHISHCALTYFCPAARNYFLNRWEAPLPTSPSCNSRCLGCISFQPKQSKISSTQNRITFVPTPEEIAEIAITHLNTAPNPIVSFGQGCEGEPLMVWETIEKSIRLIRRETDKGIININTNGSNPKAISILCDAGLDSARISMNSAREELYNIYYRPVGYSFTNVMESMDVLRANRRWVSVNYFVFPGITDHYDELEALKRLIQKHKINMIQWRNFNIDPEWYLGTIGQKFMLDNVGVENMMSDLKTTFPHLYHGYFNPGLEIIRNAEHYL